MVTGSDFGRLVEQEFRRLRRYVPALTIDQEQADDLVQDCLGGRWPSNTYGSPTRMEAGCSRRFTAAYSSQPDEAECFLFSECSTDGFASR
jgi:hypothetical protein